MPEMVMAGGVRFTPASTIAVKLTPACWLASPAQPKTPLTTPLASRTTTFARSLLPSHRQRETGRASRWSRRPADSSERAAVSCPAAVKATRTARIRKHTPSTASAPLPCAPSLANTCCTDDPEIVPPADRAMSPNSRAAKLVGLETVSPQQHVGEMNIQQVHPARYVTPAGFASDLAADPGGRLDGSYLERGQWRVRRLPRHLAPHRHDGDQRPQGPFHPESGRSRFGIGHQSLHSGLTYPTVRRLSPQEISPGTCVPFPHCAHLVVPKVRPSFHVSSPPFFRRAMRCARADGGGDRQNHFSLGRFGAVFRRLAPAKVTWRARTKTEAEQIEVGPGATVQIGLRPTEIERVKGWALSKGGQYPGVAPAKWGSLPLSRQLWPSGGSRHAGGAGRPSLIAAAPARRNHLDAFNRHDAHVPAPLPLRPEGALRYGCDVVWHRRMDAAQDHAGPLQWLTTLQRNLPEVLVQRQDQPGLGFRALQQGGGCVARTDRKSTRLNS